MLKYIIKCTDALKPVLIKIIPIDVLRKIKRKLLSQNENKLSEIQITSFEKDKYPIGINLIGNIKGDSGLGQSCRLLANELEHCGYPVCFYQHSVSKNLSMKDTSYDDKLKKDIKYGINIFHINPHEFAISFVQLGKKIWDSHYNIAFWLWELEEFPDEWLPCLNCVDEIWTPSEFTSASIRKKTNKPVITIPYHIELKTDINISREDFGLPKDEFLFLMMYDQGSMTERKNPMAVIRAYKQAFTDKDEKAGLVIKVNNCTEEELQFLKSQMDDYHRVYFITETLSREQVNGLIACVDAVVSLHRAEGFGLVLAEAMLLGTPVIATNWSSNTEFMTTDVSCLVDYKLIELQEDLWMFKKGNRWADADVSQAAEYMRKLYDDPEYGMQMAQRAKKHITECLSMQRAVSLINAQVERIYGEQRT